MWNVMIYADKRAFAKLLLWLLVLGESLESFGNAYEQHVLEIG